MKKILAILSICFLPVLALAQSDTTKKDPLFIVDGQKVTKEKMYKYDPTEINTVEVLKSSENVKPYGEDGKNGVVVITTKKHVIETYQKTLSAKSKEYTGYLASVGDDDKDVLYVLNGTPLTDPPKTINTLYGLKPDDIKDVRFGRNLAFGNIQKKYLVDITTAEEK